MTFAPDGAMHAAARTDLDRWRDAGLVVDEDFERGISPRARNARTGFMAAVVAFIALAAGYLFTAGHLDDARRVHAPGRRAIRPVQSRPVAHSRRNA